MADHKFTLEEILNEYSADGKRSGIRHTSEQPLSRGTLETEKLVNAATSERPLSRERAGYDTVAPPPENAEELVDIKSTISHIKASKAAQAAQEADAAPVLRERFPTQHLRRENVSFVNAAGAGRYQASYTETGDSGYDGAVKLMEEDTAAPQRHRPNVRQIPPVHGKRKRNAAGMCRTVPTSRNLSPANSSGQSRWERMKSRRFRGGTGRKNRTITIRAASRPAGFALSASGCGAIPLGQMRKSGSPTTWNW